MQCKWVGLVAAVMMTAVGCSSDSDSSLSSWVRVEHRRVAETITLTGIVERPSLGALLAMDAGRLTAEVAQAEVSVGSILTSINDRAVVIAELERPLYRTLQLGSEGPDVRALRGALESLGYSSSPSDNFDQGLADIVRQWQADIGSPVDGVVRASEIASPATLPCLPRSSLSKGDLVSVGDLIADCRAVKPVVTATVSASARATLADAIDIALVSSSGPIPGRLIEIDETPLTLEDGSVRYAVHFEADSDLGLIEGATSTVTVTTADFGTGLAVPAGSIRQGENGEYVVEVRRQGGALEDVVVTIVGTDGNWTRVDGALSVDDEVRLGSQPDSS